VVSDVLISRVATIVENPVQAQESERTSASPEPSALQPALKREDWPSSIKSLAATIVIAVFVITFVVQAFQIPSESMENTLLIGDYVLVDKVSFGESTPLGFMLPYRDIQRDDVVVFKYPFDANPHFVKRVIGVPGDRIHLEQGRVYVNHKLVSEPFALYKPRGKDPYRDNFPNVAYNGFNAAQKQWLAEFPSLVRGTDLVVPEGNYFVLGDNRNESSDSRYWGFVPRENVVGRPLLVYFSVGNHDATAAATQNGKIDGFMARIWSLPGAVRWSRAFRFVK
jgi:signal peptidase I